MRQNLAIAALLAAMAMLASCGKETSKFKSVDVTGANWGKELALTGHDGKVRTLADFQGKVVVLTFGFTHCPDVCPTTLAEASQALKQLGPDAKRVQVLLVTLDPARDTSEVLSRYVTAFDPSFLGLSGDAAATKRVAEEFKIFYAVSKGQTPGSYAVDHSAQSYVLDAKGRLRLFVSQARLGEHLADDLRTLLREDG